MPIEIRSLILCAALGGLSGACGSDSQRLGIVPGHEPLYAITTQVVIPPAAFTSYVLLVPSLDPSGPLDLGSALEEPGRAIGVGPPGRGRLFVLAAESPVITRYDVGDGTFRKGPQLSLAAQGVTFAPASAQQFIFLSETKAYFLDSSTLQLFVWDPEQMLVVDVIGLKEFERPGWTPVFLQTPSVRGTQVLFVTSYFRAEDDRYDRETRLGIVDSTDDRVERLVAHDRCAFIGHALPIPSGDGDIYFGSGASPRGTRRRGEGGGFQPRWIPSGECLPGRYRQIVVHPGLSLWYLGARSVSPAQLWP